MGKKNALLLMLLVVVLQSCDNRPKTNAENNTELISKAPTTIDRLEDFRSALRPDQELKIGKIYLDTVEFLFADFDYDYWLMHVRKNGNTVEFIIDKRYDFKRSEQLVVTWKVDSIWIVGNRESLYFSERLISAKQVIISPTNEIWQVEGDGYSLTVEAVDSIQFHAVKKTIRHNTQEITKITDFAKVKKMLDGVVEFVENDHYTGLRKIIFRNGAIYDNPSDIAAFVAYYPTEDIILLEGGHSTDVSFDLKNGKQTEETGNPDYIIASPSNQHRLNGYFEGQTCSAYFIQKNSNGTFENAIPLNKAFTRNGREHICGIQEAFWTNGSTLFLKEILAWAKNDRPTPTYYKVSILKAEPKLATGTVH